MNPRRKNEILKIKTVLALSLIFIFGFLVRFFPVRNDSSFHHWDETVYLQHSEILAGLRPDNYNEFDYRPPLLPFIISLAYRLYHSVVVAHFLVAILSSFSIIIVFFIALLVFNDVKIGLLSALLMCLNPLHISLSHEIRVDSLITTFYSLVFLFLLLSIKKKKSIYSILTGISIGLSILLKFTSLSLLIPVFLILFLRIEKGNKISIQKNIFRDKRVYFVLFGIFLATSPYLAHNLIVYKHPVLPFIISFKIIMNDIPEPWYYFILHFFDLIPTLFVIGIISYFISVLLHRKLDKLEVCLLIFTFIPFMLLTIIIHKEVRYATLVLPFLSIISGAGIIRLFELKWLREFIPIFIALVVITSLNSLSNYIDPIFNGKLIIENQSTAVMQAAFWIKNNTSQSAIIYCNFQCPPLAYYSYRKTYYLIIKEGKNIQDKIESIMKEPGYLVLSSCAHEDLEPKLEFILKDKRFHLIKTFSDGGETIYIFKYR